MKLTFSDTVGVLPEFAPKPASAFVPEWYKKTSSYLDGHSKLGRDNNSFGTIKRCMPVFDAMTAGYIIVSPADVYVNDSEEDKNVPYYQWADYGLISFHPVAQAKNHPAKNGYDYPKWHNPWGIKSPKGYSTLFVSPMHQDLPFTILPGIVDTDTYTAPVNFPFVLNDPSWRGLIPAGTPLAQVIPFKRESWEMEFGSERDLYESKVLNPTRLKIKFYDAYKSLFRVTKEYK